MSKDTPKAPPPKPTQVKLGAEPQKRGQVPTMVNPPAPPLKKES